MTKLVPKLNSGISEWMWRGIVLCVLTGQLWVSTKFVSIEDFRKAEVSLREVHDKVIVIEQAVKGSERIERDLNDLGVRLRVIEVEASARELRVRELETKMKK